MIGKHYSIDAIAVGDKIVSDQSHFATFNLVWSFYKVVADELGVYFPTDYGYAYPVDVPKPIFRDQFLQIVEAPDDKITFGNYDYSVYAVMDRLGSFTDKSLPLAERIAKRNKQLQDAARKYFDTNVDPDKLEIISDAWVVTKSEEI